MREPKIAVQSSALSLLAACLETSFTGCTPFLPTIVDAALGVLQTERKFPQIRRGAVYLLAAFIQGVEKQVLDALADGKAPDSAALDVEMLAKVRTALAILESGSGVLGEPSTAEDDIVRGHARVALEQLAAIVGNRLQDTGKRTKGGLNAAMWRKREGEARAVQRLLPGSSSGVAEEIGLEVRSQRRL